jgi:hypothetical protein
VTNQQAERWRIRRDALIVAFSLGMLGTEIAFLGARAHVIVALSGLLSLPAVLRVDEARRREQ